MSGWRAYLARLPQRHSTVIEAIARLGDQRFSGWEIARQTDVPRTTVSRVMRVLLQMGLLTFGSGGTPWRTSPSWPHDTRLIGEQYVCWLESRRWAKRNVDKGRALMV